MVGDVVELVFGAQVVVGPAGGEDSIANHAAVEMKLVDAEGAGMDQRPPDRLGDIERPPQIVGRPRLPRIVVGAVGGRFAAARQHKIAGDPRCLPVGRLHEAGVDAGRLGEAGGPAGLVPHRDRPEELHVRAKRRAGIGDEQGLAGLHPATVPERAAAGGDLGRIGADDQAIGALAPSTAVARQAPAQTRRRRVQPTRRVEVFACQGDGAERRHDGGEPSAPARAPRRGRGRCACAARWRRRRDRGRATGSLR